MDACGEGASRPIDGRTARPLEGSQVGQLPPRMGAGGAKEVKAMAKKKVAKKTAKKKKVAKKKKK